MALFLVIYTKIYVYPANFQNLLHLLLLHLHLLRFLGPRPHNRAQAQYAPGPLSSAMTAGHNFQHTWLVKTILPNRRIYSFLRFPEVGF